MTMINTAVFDDIRPYHDHEVKPVVEALLADFELARALAKFKFPRAYALAEASWTQKKNYAGFKNRLVIYIKEQEQAGNICTPVDWWDPRGKARLEESIRYVREMFPDTYKDIQEQTEDIVQINATFLKAMLTGFFNIWDRPKVARALSKPGPNS